MAVLCERLHQTPTGEGIFEQDPHIMRRLEIVWGVIDAVKQRQMTQMEPPSGP